MFNSKTKFGSVAIILHWVSAAVVVGQFGFGWYMLSLDYYHPDYKVLPHYHKSIGILFAIMLLFRIIWQAINRRPEAAAGVKAWEHKVARVVHWILLGGLVAVVILGYLTATAIGDPVLVFNWFEVSAIGVGIERQADIAGELHYWFAVGVMSLAGLHAAAALKHHFIDGDDTLRRMWRTPKSK